MTSIQYLSLNNGISLDHPCNWPAADIVKRWASIHTAFDANILARVDAELPDRDAEGPVDAMITVITAYLAIATEDLVVLNPVESVGQMLARADAEKGEQLLRAHRKARRRMTAEERAFEAACLRDPLRRDSYRWRPAEPRPRSPR
jgi:hypothetical protein